MFVFIHTVTLNYNDYEISAEFYHSMTTEQEQRNGNQMMFKLLGKKIAVHHKRSNCNKINNILKPNLRMLMKPRRNSVRHSICALNIGSRNNYMANLLSSPSYIKGEEPVNASATNLAVSQSCTNSPGIVHENNKSQGSTSRSNLIFNLSSASTVEETMTWLTNNNFNAYLNTFASFSGADMLRLSRDDFIQICGLADGIRLYNALHAKTIIPKLTLYICTERSNAFNAIYLNSYTNEEFGNKLSTLIQMSQDQIQGYFIQGPNGIHIHINDEVIRHLKNETMYTVEIIPDLNSNTYRVLLKSLNS